MLKTKYGAAFPRKTELRNFENIEAAKVIEANEKLYINREEGFIGTSLKKDEFVSNCSSIDDVILFYKDGRYKIVRVTEKMFVGTGVMHLGIYKKNDKRTIYNVVYRDGRGGPHYIKRFAVTGTNRDREYNLTQGKPGSRVAYFTANPNGEAEIIKVQLKPVPNLRKTVIEKDFSEIGIKGRSSMGNLLTRLEVQRIGLKAHGASTLGGRKVWFDRDILRLDFDGHGEYLGEFHSDDRILVVLTNGEFYITDFDANNHYEPNILYIEKFNSDKVWTAIVKNASQKGFYYIKRFLMEATPKKNTFVDDHKDSTMVLLTCETYPLIQVNFGGGDSFREPLVIDAEEFALIKGFKAIGKRVTTFEVDSFVELEPTRRPEPEKPETPETENIGDTEILEEPSTEQLNLFEEE
jgi:topoisomerase-4 subunit A